MGSNFTTSLAYGLKGPRSFAPVECRDHVNWARNADHAARVCGLYDYQTWKIHFWRNSRGAQRVVGFFLDCADWLSRQTPLWVLTSLINWIVFFSSQQLREIQQSNRSRPKRKLHQTYITLPTMWFLDHKSRMVPLHRKSRRHDGHPVRSHAPL